jgi:DNA-binding CsgD family transcriptional regulator
MAASVFSFSSATEELTPIPVPRVSKLESSQAAGAARPCLASTPANRHRSTAVSSRSPSSVARSGASPRISETLGARKHSHGWREPSIYGELPNAIEALVELAELGEAHSLLAELQDRLSRIDSLWGEASAGRCEGLILAADGDLAAATLVLERALTAHERLPQPFDLARTLLTLGTVQRRTRKRGAARESLERSLATFDELGATLWAEKARSELLRIGGRTAAGDDLTPTERRIADLVARGKTNKEVAAQLFITARTVEGHLTRIYAKLDVRSRAELAHRTSMRAG